MLKTKVMAEAIAATLRMDGYQVAADVVIRIEQQRAELLDALKGIIASVDKGQCVMLDKAREAITKAEAAE